MYVTSNYYQKDARYIDMSDLDFFHYSLKLAEDQLKKRLDEKGSFTKEEIDEAKMQEVPVMYATTVSKKQPDEVFLARKQISPRARNRHLIIDADFDKGEENEAENFKRNCVALSNEYQTPIVIYPTPSYPDKPRFRVIFFVKRVLSEATYYQAMTWLYEELNTEPNDKSDLHIKSSNNAPSFFNEAQLAGVIDTTQEKDLQPLDNSLWRDFDKPKYRKSSSHKSKYDIISITNDELVIGSTLIAPMIGDDYDFFWKFASSVYRAEHFEQIDQEQAENVMKIIASGITNQNRIKEVELENMAYYRELRGRLINDEVSTMKARPLLSYDEIKSTILSK